MKRLLIVLVAALALFASSCGSSGSSGENAVAASVNGTDISTGTLMADLAAFSASPTYMKRMTGQEDAAIGATAGSYDTAFTAQVLRDLVVAEVIVQEVQARGLTVTDADRATAESGFNELFGADAATVPEDFKARQIEAYASQAALIASFEADLPGGEPTEEEIRAYYDEKIDAIMEQSGDFACVSHILVAWSDDPDPQAEPATPTAEQDAAALAKANAIEARLAAGENFGTIAAAESADPGSAAQNGDLGCTPAGSGYVAEFETAVFAQPVGEVGPPVRSQFGYHIILVRSRGQLPFDEVKADIKDSLVQQRSDSSSAVQAWFVKAMADADITIDPRFGTWDPATGVVPPEGASTETTVTTALSSDDGLVPEGG